MGKKNKQLKNPAVEKRNPVTEYAVKEKKQNKKPKNPGQRARIEAKKRISQEFELNKMASNENPEAKRPFSKGPLAMEVQSSKPDPQSSFDG